ncbi:MAG: 3-methyl-2-oxobutanoate hydroxymethyltransferase [Candidatus Omnitrophica bacterium]|nr:3-methyl-2-oxobutanoate hydroxymethyltransferase [Candidatus Omnitrophota bacterium]
MSKITINDIIFKKGKEKIIMLTCYDYSFAKILDTLNIDMILVGDSLANVVLGLPQTRLVSFKEMFNHMVAVAKATTKSLVVLDMPYVCYQKDPKKSLYYAEKFLKSGADAIKIEWFNRCPYVVKTLIKNKIPVMGHIGLTPQTVHLLGGFKVQGKDLIGARNLINQAKILEDLGVFSIVCECIPWQLARFITKNVKIPTIGIGAGKYCDGQVLVLYDVLGLYKEKRPKFVRVYKDIGEEIKKALEYFIFDVKNKKFPTIDESFSMKNKEWLNLLKVKDASIKKQHSKI